MNLLAQDSQPLSPSYRTIPLTKGMVAIVDAEDYEWLAKYSWHVEWNKNTQSYYAARTEHMGVVNGKQKVKAFRMHREILGLKHGDPREGDHIRSGETLDNRRSNLRIATQAQNKMNSRLSKNSTSGLKGAHWHIHVKKWASSIMFNKKLIHLGYCDTALEAHLLYCEAAKKYHGDYARFA